MMITPGADANDRRSFQSRIATHGRDARDTTSAFDAAIHHLPSQTAEV